LPLLNYVLDAEIYYQISLQLGGQLIISTNYQLPYIGNFHIKNNL